MNNPRRHFLELLGTCLGSASVGNGVFAKSFSHGSLRVVVGFPVGGSTDTLARLLAEQLRRAGYAESVMVDNRPGAAGRIALTRRNVSTSEEQTAFLVPCSLLTIYPHVYKKLSYNPAADFLPAATFARGDFALVVGPMVPDTVRTPRDMAEWFKSHPDRAFFASPAAGATPHFAGLAFARAAGITLTHTAYKGDAPGIQDIMGGQIACGVHSIGAVLPHLKGSRLRAIATSGAERAAFLPSVPTFVESGFRDIVMGEWIGLLFSAGTPQAVVDDFAEAIGKVAGRQDFVDALLDVGFEADVLKSLDFNRFLAKERQRWGPIVDASGFQGEE